MVGKESGDVRPVDGGADRAPVGDVNWYGVVACCLIASFTMRNVDGRPLEALASILGVVGVVVWIASFARSRHSGSDSRLLPWVAAVAAVSFVLTLVTTWS